MGAVVREKILSHSDGSGARSAEGQQWVVVRGTCRESPELSSRRLPGRDRTSPRAGLSLLLLDLPPHLLHLRPHPGDQAPEAGILP